MNRVGKKVFFENYRNENRNEMKNYENLNILCFYFINLFLHGFSSFN